MASRRDFLTRGFRGRAVAAQSPAAEVSARDLRKLNRDEVRQALRRIRAQKRVD